MSFRKSRPITPAKLAANRKNAQKSTGPRTAAGKRRASLNRYQHGHYATLDSRRRQAHEDLRDDPAEFERLHQDLFAAWKPANAMQALVVSDLAGLYWKKMQLENTTLSARLREKQRWVSDEENRILQDRRMLESGADVVPQSGYRGALHSAACFEQACLLLDEITECLDDHQRVHEIELDLNGLFGVRPSNRGHEILGLFRQFAADKDGAYPILATELKRLIAEERACIIQEHELAQRREQEALRESKPSVWEPGASNWNLIVGVESDLDDEIAQKVKLLIQLKNLPQTFDEPESGSEEESESDAAGKSSNSGNEPEN